VFFQKPNSLKPLTKRGEVGSGVNTSMALRPKYVLALAACSVVVHRVSLGGVTGLVIRDVPYGAVCTFSRLIPLRHGWSVHVLGNERKRV
jgi:hypothetical protein